MSIDTSLKARRSKRQLLVENKISFAGPETELSIYDTYRASLGVGLDADQLLYCGMIDGKKIMHSFAEDPGELFLPHESFVIPPGGHVDIDFPEACEAHPTTCLTIEISQQRVEQLSQRMRDLTHLGELDHDWQYEPLTIHTHHTSETQGLLEKLVALFTQNHPDKEIMVDLGVSELVIRLLREQGRNLLLDYCLKAPDASGITAAVNFIHQQLAEPLDIDCLCQAACMSRSKLYAEFKKQLGCSPGEYQQQVRLKAAAEALKKGKTVTQACYDLGFNDLSHFSRRFSRFYNCAPSQFRSKYHRTSA
ncbi:MAG: AraC family transcriptional regulator N-terminal domain-containing protein [Pseudomonadales bacterium]|jgi:AraC-like DNA-binding protein